MSNGDRVEKIQQDLMTPVVEIRTRESNGGMSISDWTLRIASCTEFSVHQLHRQSARVGPRIFSGCGGEWSPVAGAGSVWFRVSQVLRAFIDSAMNRVTTLCGPPAGIGAARVVGDLEGVIADEPKAVCIAARR